MAQVKERVAGRYPEAAPLPDPPVLDDLLREAGFDFRWEPGGKDGQGCYVSNVRDMISVTTGTQATPRYPTTSARPAAGEVTPEEADARQFEERLQRAISEGSFLSLLVNPKLYDRARAGNLPAVPGRAGGHGRRVPRRLAGRRRQGGGQLGPGAQDRRHAAGRRLGQADDAGQPRHAGGRAAAAHGRADRCS